MTAAGAGHTAHEPWKYRSSATVLVAALPKD